MNTGTSVWASAVTILEIRSLTRVSEFCLLRSPLSLEFTTEFW